MRQSLYIFHGMRGRIGSLCFRIIAAVLGHWNLHDSNGQRPPHILWLEARCRSVVKTHAVIPLSEALAMGTHCIKSVLMAYRPTLLQTKLYQDFKTRSSLCGSSVTMSSITKSPVFKFIDDEAVTSHPAHGSHCLEMRWPGLCLKVEWRGQNEQLK